MIAGLLATSAGILGAAHAAAFIPSDCASARRPHDRNGTMIVGRFTESGLSLATAGGRIVKRLTKPRGRVVDVNASFSPDARHAVFERYDNRTQTGSIWTLDIATRRVHRIHAPTGKDFDEWPVWAPDGKHIAFVHEVDGGETGFHGSVVVVRPDGSGLTTRYAPAFAPEVPARLLDWSPNGRCLAFYSILPLETGGTTEGIVVAPAKGGGPAWGIYPKGGTFPGGRTGSPNGVAFSADGRRLFIADDLGLHNDPIRAISLVDHGLPRRIGHRALEFDPVPSPDGRLLAYGSRGTVYTQPLRGGRARTLVRRAVLYDWAAG